MSPYSDTVLYRLALSFVTGVGHVTAKDMITYAGNDVKQLFSMPRKTLINDIKLKKSMAYDFVKEREDCLRRAEEELKLAEKEKIFILEYGQEGYPKKLGECYDAPLILYVKGNPKVNFSKTLAVVGTRKITDYGKKLCSLTAETLCDWDGTIISGLAFGVDIDIHKKTMKQGIPNVAVLGHGFSDIYPPEHKKYADQITEKGCLITEFSFFDQPNGSRFPARNRIIAGLSDALLVVESGKTGGSLITAKYAFNYNREIFTFPGKIFDDYSAGCNRLITKNKAQLIHHPDDILYHMNWGEGKKNKGEHAASLFDNLSKEEKKIIELLKHHDTLHVDELCVLTQLNTSMLSMYLLDLEMKKKITVLPGKKYKICY